MKCPSWFKHWCIPQEPRSTLWRYVTLGSFTSSDGPIYINSISNSYPEATHIHAGCDNDIIVSKREELPNVNYEKELKRYNEWLKYKQLWDQEQEHKNKEERRRQYYKLKKEFGE